MTTRPSHVELPTMTDGGVLLRPMEPRDLPTIEASIHDPDVIRWIGPQPPTANDVLAQDDAWLARGSPTLAICEPGGTCVGKIWLEVQEADRSIGFVGYWLLPAARGRGLASAAVRLVSAWAVSEFGVPNVRIRTAPDKAITTRRRAGRLSTTTDGARRTEGRARQ